MLTPGPTDSAAIGRVSSGALRQWRPRSQRSSNVENWSKILFRPITQNRTFRAKSGHSGLYQAVRQRQNARQKSASEMRLATLQADHEAATHPQPSQNLNRYRCPAEPAPIKRPDTESKNAVSTALVEWVPW